MLREKSCAHIAAYSCTVLHKTSSSRSAACPASITLSRPRLALPCRIRRERNAPLRHFEAKYFREDSQQATCEATRFASSSQITHATRVSEPRHWNVNAVHRVLFITLYFMTVSYVRCWIIFVLLLSNWIFWRLKLSRRFVDIFFEIYLCAGKVNVSVNCFYRVDQFLCRLLLWKGTKLIPVWYGVLASVWWFVMRCFYLLLSALLLWPWHFLADKRWSSETEQLLVVSGWRSIAVSCRLYEDMKRCDSHCVRRVPPTLRPRRQVRASSACVLCSSTARKSSSTKR